MEYTGFPIYDFKTGLYSEKEPWISPQDAFAVFNNCRLNRGILEKRTGYTQFSRLYYKVEDITDITQADPAVVTTSGNHGLSTGDFVTFNEVGGMTEINGLKSPVTVLSATTFSLDAIDSTGFTAYTANGILYNAPNVSGCVGINSITKADQAVITTSANHGLSPNDTVAILLMVNGMEELLNVYSSVTVLSPTRLQLDNVDTTLMTPYIDGGYLGLYSSGQITGIAEFINNAGQGTLLASDNKRIGLYNSTTEDIYDIALADIFTGTVNDTFIFQNWLSKIYFTNDVDRVQSWDGTTLSSITIDIDGDGNNDVDTAQDIKLFGNRLILFAPTENGTKQYQRFRWSGINAPTVWDDTIIGGGGFLDISTGEKFISSAYIKDKIMLKFERSTWILSNTGNINLPFSAEKIDSTYTNSSKNGSCTVSDKTFSLGPNGVSVSNGFRVETFNKIIPEFLDDLFQSRTAQFYAQVFDQDDEIWMSYPSSDETVNDRALVYRYDNNTFSLNDINISTFGTFKTNFDKTWSGEPRTWDVISERWNDFSSFAGFPIVFFGDEYGNIMQLSESSNDNGKNINMNLKTSRFNPFKDAFGSSVSSQLGEVQFLVDTDEFSTLTVDLYINFDDTPYKTVTFDLNAVNDTTEKVLKIVHSGAIGQSHRIGLRNNEAYSSLKIHMIKPFLRPVGEMKQIV